MTGKLQGIGHVNTRHLMGNKALSSGTLAIHGTNAENVKTSATITFTIKGIFYSKSAAAEIDLSTLSGLPTTALADGKTQIFGLELNSSGTVSVVYGEQVDTADIAAGDAEVNWPVASDDDHTIFGAIKVVNASGSDFTLGATALSATGVTDTYYNLMNSSY